MEKLKFVNKEKILELMENKEDFKLVEALVEEDYKQGHLPNAVNIPANKADELVPEMLTDKNQAIIVYCSDYLCQASTGLSRKLQEMGYTNVMDYKGGKKDWADAGLPLLK